VQLRTWTAGLFLAFFVFSLFSCSKTTGDMVSVPLSATNSAEFYIDPYEARIVSGKAESTSGVAPEVNVDYATAKAACEAAGKRLCTTSEWFAACVGANNRAYAFQDSESSPVSIDSVCDVARTENNTPGSLPSLTGAHPSCKTEGLNLYDMIGNLAEWTTDASGTPVAAGEPFYLASGATLADAKCVTTTTDIGSPTIDPATKSTDVGFRCCKDPEATATSGGSGTAPTFPF